MMMQTAAIIIASPSAIPEMAIFIAGEETRFSFFLSPLYIRLAIKNSVFIFLLSRLEGDQYFNGDEAQKLLQRAILTLPDKQRLVFQMKYFDEMKYEEMSEILSTSVGALKASYHHAVKKIENFLTDSN
jgi:RNA polymerase sigma factor (sigma-70 family)